MHIHFMPVVNKPIKLTYKTHVITIFFIILHSTTTQYGNMTNFIYYLSNLDKNITLMLNYDGGSVQDTFWICFSSRLIWILPALLFLVYLFNKKKNWKEAMLVILALVLVVTLCDQIASTIMKPYFARLRPSHTPGVENLLHYVNAYRGSNYGFASSHAANSFGAITFVCLLLRNRITTILLTLMAILTSFSRIYLGVHYLGDILTGALLGVVIGYLFYRMLPHKCHEYFKLTGALLCMRPQKQ